MPTYDALAHLPLEIESYGLEGLSRVVSAGFERLTTVVVLRGGGEEGVGEDVSYDAADHRAQVAHGPTLPLAGSWTLASLAAHLERLDLHPAGPPVRPVSRRYRRWAFEGAALDLALRQDGRPLYVVLGWPPQPVEFVVSLGLGDPPRLERVLERLALYPRLRFKLDARSSWTPAVIDALAATGAVASIDFKGAYVGSHVEQPPDPTLYVGCAEAFPDAWLEDPALTPATEAVLAPHRGRVTWDAPIHGIEDIVALPFPPGAVNLKPSRLGSLAALCAAYDFCAERGLPSYGGGQFELGPGRGQIQYLASLFHPTSPNDVAPGGYDAEPTPLGLPESPLPPAPAPVGFRWGD